MTDEQYHELLAAITILRHDYNQLRYLVVAAISTGLINLAAGV